MIEVSRLGFGYREIPIFTTFSFSVKKGEAWTIIGPSGCGKTTLLFLIAGLNRPATGAIRIAGRIIDRPRPETGLVLQDHGLLPWSTIYENTLLGFQIRRFYGPDGKHSPAEPPLDRKEERKRIDYWLDWLGIAHLGSMYPAQLSRGQRQRAAIARTLVLEPDLLLMDEPFSALDAPIRDELQKVMNRFHRESGLTSLTVTHDIEEALILGEKILVLGNSCNRKPRVVDNPFSKEIDRRTSPDFQECCRQLHQEIAACSLPHPATENL